MVNFSAVKQKLEVAESSQNGESFYKFDKNISKRLSSVLL